MKKLRLFLDNFLIYGLGGIISKMIPLIMVPVVTRLMPDTTYYGISDVSNTILSFASAIAVMGMYDAMYRMFFDKDTEEYRKTICSTTFCFTLITSLLVFFILIFLRRQIAERLLDGLEYSNIVFITAISALIGATNNIVAAPTRMQNKRRVYLIMNTIGPIVSYTISIALLLKGYYILALPLARLISSLAVEVSFGILNHKWFSFRNFDVQYLKPLLSIGLPLLPNFLIYWVFNSCDKLMITQLMGMSATGIYSVGSKFGQMSQLIYTAFAGGWQYFAFSTMKEENQVRSNSMVFEYLGVISFLAGIFVCACSKSVFQVLFEKEYAEGYIVAPYLFLAPLLQMLFQVSCNQFIVVKKTWPNIFILSVGAVGNILFNLYLIPEIGIEGAAIGTLLGYITSNVIGIIVLCKMKLMTISKRFVLSALLAGSYFIIWRNLFQNDIFGGILGASGITIIVFMLYKNDIFYLVKEMKREH